MGLTGACSGRPLCPESICPCRTNLAFGSGTARIRGESHGKGTAASVALGNLCCLVKERCIVIVQSEGLGQKVWERCAPDALAL